MISMNPMSWLFAKGAMEGLADGLVGRVVQGAWKTEVVQTALKEKMPGFLGLSVTDEAKWAELLTGLSTEDVAIITDCKNSLDQKHRDRWRLVLTSLSIEGLMTREWKDYKITTPSNTEGASPTVREGREPKDVPVLRGSSNDPRIKHLKQVVQVYEQALGTADGTADEKKADAIKTVKRFLFTNFIAEVPFFDRFTGWFQDQVRNGWERATDAEAAFVLQYFAYEIGDDRFRSIILSRKSLREKMLDLQQALQEKVNQEEDAVDERDWPIVAALKSKMVLVPLCFMIILWILLALSEN